MPNPPACAPESVKGYIQDNHYRGEIRLGYVPFDLVPIVDNIHIQYVNDTDVQDLGLSPPWLTSQTFQKKEVPELDPDDDTQKNAVYLTVDIDLNFVPEETRDDAIQFGFELNDQPGTFCIFMEENEGATAPNSIFYNDNSPGEVYLAGYNGETPSKILADADLAGTNVNAIMWIPELNRLAINNNGRLYLSKADGTGVELLKDFGTGNNLGIAYNHSQGNQGTFFLGGTSLKAWDRALDATTTLHSAWSNYNYLHKRVVGGKIYFSTTDAGAGSGQGVYSVSATTPGTPAVLFSQINVAAIVINEAANEGAGYIWYVDSWNGRVSRRDLADGANQANLVTSGIASPSGIDYDPIGLKIYWSEGGASSDVKRCNPDGSSVEALISDTIGFFDVALGFVPPT